MDNNRIFIGNLDFSVTAEVVERLLSHYGTVRAVTMNRKKGFAFVEMEHADSAAQAVQQLDGKLHKGRTLRVSFAMKARRARTATAKRYKEKGDAFARQRAARYQPAQQSFEEKPTYRGRPAGAGERPAYRRTSKPYAGFTSRAGMRAADAGPLRTYQRDTGAPGRPVRRPWSEEKPSYPRPAERDRGRDGYARAPQKEWPSARPSRAPVKTGETRGGHPQRKKTSGGKSHDFLKQRPAGGTHGTYRKPSRPGARRAAGASAPARHTFRGTSQDRGTPRKETEQ